MKKFNDYIKHWRFFCLLIIPALALLAGSGASRLGFSSDYRVFFSKDNPQLNEFERMQKTYVKSDNLLIVLAPASGTVFDPTTLDAIKWITNQSWQTPYSVRVDSITNFQRAKADGDTINVADLVPKSLQPNNAQLAEIKKFALSEPLLAGRLISPSGAVTGINVTYQLPEKSP
ncbi:MAG: hypothetical protein RL748_2691, partial [Pseudomonadota bacterium]